MIQAHYIYCALYFYCYYISSTSDHQALDLDYFLVHNCPVPLALTMNHRLECFFLIILFMLFVCVCSVLSHVLLFAATGTVARQASLSMEISRQEY